MSSMHRLRAVFPGFLLLLLTAVSPAPGQETILLRPGKLFDGQTARLHEDWAVLVTGDRIAGVGPESTMDVSGVVREIDLPNLTLLPGLIEVPPAEWFMPKGV